MVGFCVRGPPAVDEALIGRHWLGTHRSPFVAESHSSMAFSTVSWHSGGTARANYSRPTAESWLSRKRLHALPGIVLSTALFTIMEILAINNNLYAGIYRTVRYLCLATQQVI